jgi:ectoine hydroxylase-related dioxygenase (phytanoyl-CoA dioxygenase family)
MQADCITASSDLGAIGRQLDEQGYCVVPGVLDAQALDIVRSALDRVIAEDDAAGTALRYGPKLTNQRIWALLNRADEFVPLAMNPFVLSMVRMLLGIEDVLISTVTANITRPGGDEGIGRLHTDQGYLPAPWPFKIACNVAFFLDDYTEDNGATVFVPGSHKSQTWPHQVPPPDPEATAFATGPAGSVVIWDGRLHHATGLNRTPDKQRRGIIVTYIAPFIRGQENWCRSMDRRLLEKYPGLAALTGFVEWQTLGGVNGAQGSGLNF